MFYLQSNTVVVIKKTFGNIIKSKSDEYIMIIDIRKKVQKVAFKE